MATAPSRNAPVVRPKGPPAPPTSPYLEPPESPTLWWEVILSIVLALLVMTACWFVPRPTGDLYVALAGARDVCDGKLGKTKGIAGPGTAVTPDTPGAPLVTMLGWFGVHTGGPDDWGPPPRPVWMNQNWGTHMLFSAAWHTFGKNGVPGLKGFLMLTMAAGIALACRQHRARWPVCILLGGLAVIGGWAYIDLRPNIILLTLAPMMYWLLVRSRHNSRRIWWALLLLLLWGNMHGSFIFGLGMVAIWVVCHSLPAAVKDAETFPQRIEWFCIIGFFSLLPLAALMACIVTGVSMFRTFGGEPGYWLALLWPMGGLYLVRYAPEPVRAGFRRWLPALLAPVIGALLVTILTPFGLENLTHPLVMSSAEWRKVAEWMPVLPLEPVSYGSTGEFFVAMGVVSLLMAVRPLTNILLGRRPGLGDAALVAFSLLIGMAVALSAYQVKAELGQRIWSYQKQMQYQGIPRAEITQALAPFVDLQSDAEIPFYVFLCITAVAAYTAVRVIRGFAKADSFPAPAEKHDFSLVIFAIVMGGIVMQMAFTSRRFVTLSFGLLAPLMAMQLNWLFEQAFRIPIFRYVRPALLVGAVALVPAKNVFVKAWPHYQADNPSFMPFLNTVFDRTTDNEAYAHGGTDFLRDNEVKGNAIQEWRWEGFLHWKCPRMKVWVGGRAQQAWDEPTYVHRQEVWSLYGARRTGKEWADAQRRLLTDLAAMKVTFVVVPLDTSADAILNALLTTPGSPWLFVYYDRENAILGDSRDPQVQTLIDKVVKGEARWPDYVPGVEAGTRAMMMSSLPGRFSVDERREAIERGLREMASPEIMNRLLQMQGSGEVTPEFVRRLLSGLYADFENFHRNPYEDLKVLFARMYMARVLADMTARAAGWPGAEKVPLERWLNESQKSPQELAPILEWLNRFAQHSEQIHETNRTWR